jgi:hypothetical protein
MEQMVLALGAYRMLPTLQGKIDGKRPKTQSLGQTFLMQNRLVRNARNLEWEKVASEAL